MFWFDVVAKHFPTFHLDINDTTFIQHQRRVLKFLKPKMDTNFPHYFYLAGFFPPSDEEEFVQWFTKQAVASKIKRTLANSPSLDAEMVDFSEIISAPSPEEASSSKHTSKKRERPQIANNESKVVFQTKTFVNLETVFRETFPEQVVNTFTARPKYSKMRNWIDSYLKTAGKPQVMYAFRNSGGNQFPAELLPAFLENFEKANFGQAVTSQDHIIDTSTDDISQDNDELIFSTNEISIAEPGPLHWRNLVKLKYPEFIFDKHSEFKMRNAVSNFILKECSDCEKIKIRRSKIKLIPFRLLDEFISFFQEMEKTDFGDEEGGKQMYTSKACFWKDLVLQKWPNFVFPPLASDESCEMAGMVASDFLQVHCSPEEFQFHTKNLRKTIPANLTEKFFEWVESCGLLKWAETDSPSVVTENEMESNNNEEQPDAIVIEFVPWETIINEKYSEFDFPTGNARDMRAITNSVNAFIKENLSEEEISTLEKSENLKRIPLTKADDFLAWFKIQEEQDFAIGRTSSSPVSEDVAKGWIHWKEVISKNYTEYNLQTLEWKSLDKVLKNFLVDECNDDEMDHLADFVNDPKIIPKRLISSFLVWFKKETYISQVDPIRWQTVVSDAYPKFKEEYLSKANTSAIEKYIQCKLSSDEHDVLEQFFELMIPSRLSDQFLKWFSFAFSHLLSDDLDYSKARFRDWNEIIREENIKFDFENQREANLAIRKMLELYANAKENEDALKNRKVYMIPARLVPAFPSWFKKQRAAGFKAPLVPLQPVIEHNAKNISMSVDSSLNNFIDADMTSLHASSEMTLNLEKFVSEKSSLVPNTNSRKHELAVTSANASKRVKGKNGLKGLDNLVDEEIEGTKHNILQACLAEFDDILTDLLVDSMYLSFTTHKMSPEFCKLFCILLTT